MRIGLLLAMSASLMGCVHRPVATATTATATAEHVATADRAVVSDSTTFRETLRLHPVQVGADTADFRVQLQTVPGTGQLVPATYQTRGRRASVAVKVSATGQLTGRCRCDAEQATVAALERTVTHLQRRANQLTRTEYRDRWRERVRKVPTAPPLPWYDWLARIWTGVTVLSGLLLLLLFLAFRHRNRPPATPANG